MEVTKREGESSELKADRIDLKSWADWLDDHVSQMRCNREGHNSDSNDSSPRTEQSKTNKQTTLTSTPTGRPVSDLSSSPKCSHRDILLPRSPVWQNLVVNSVGGGE